MPTHDLRVCAIEKMESQPACIRKQPIVIADERDEVTTRIGECRLPILGHRDSRLGRKMADATVIEPAQDRFRLGVTAIILDNDLEVFVGLRNDGCERVPKRIRTSQCRNDDRQSRHRDSLVSILD